MTNEQIIEKIIEEIFNEFQDSFEDYLNHTILKYFATQDGLLNLLIDDMITVEEFKDKSVLNRKFYKDRQLDFFENRFQVHILKTKNRVLKIVKRIDKKQLKK